MVYAVDPEWIKKDKLPLLVLAKLEEQDEKLSQVIALHRKEMTLMARILDVVTGLRTSINERFDRELAKQQAAIDAKQAELDNLIAAEDAEDVQQNAEIARLQAELDAQNEAIAIIESIKSDVESDLVVATPDEPAPSDNDAGVVVGDGGIVAPVDPETGEAVVEPAPEAVEPDVEQPAQPGTGDNTGVNEDVPTVEVVEQPVITEQ